MVQNISLWQRLARLTYCLRRWFDTEYTFLKCDQGHAGCRWAICLKAGFLRQVEHKLLVYSYQGISAAISAERWLCPRHRCQSPGRKEERPFASAPRICADHDTSVGFPGANRVACRIFCLLTSMMATSHPVQVFCAVSRASLLALVFV